MRLLFIPILFFFQCAVLAEEPRYNVNIGGYYGLVSDGFVQVRENEVVGDHLDLGSDLGLDQFNALNFGLGLRLSQGWLDLNYEHYLISGDATFGRTFRYNGATYAPGKVGISKTEYRRFSLLYSHTLSGARATTYYTALGGGLLLETLKFYIDGELDASTTRDEKYESFDRQLVPVPSLLGVIQRPISENWGYGVEVGAAWLPKTKTHYVEHGRIYFWQYNLDAEAKLIRTFETSQVSIGYRYKLFHQFEESIEDTNEFRITSSGLNVKVIWYF